MPARWIDLRTGFIDGHSELRRGRRPIVRRRRALRGHRLRAARRGDRRRLAPLGVRAGRARRHHQALRGAHDVSRARRARRLPGGRFRIPGWRSSPPRRCFLGSLFPRRRRRWRPRRRAGTWPLPRHHRSLLNSAVRVRRSSWRVPPSRPRPSSDHALVDEDQHLRHAHRP